MRIRYGWLFATLCCLLSPEIDAQTEIPGGPVRGIWSVQNSPYRIRDDIQVPLGSTLIIGPGVVVESAPDVNFTVYGRLIADGLIENGSEENRIVFRALPPENVESLVRPWGGIDFLEGTTEDSLLRFATVEHATTGILLSQARPTLSHLRLVNNDEGIKAILRTVLSEG